MTCRIAFAPDTGPLCEPGAEEIGNTIISRSMEFVR